MVNCGAMPLAMILVGHINESYTQL